MSGLSVRCEINEKGNRTLIGKELDLLCGFCNLSLETLPVYFCPDLSVAWHGRCFLCSRVKCTKECDSVHVRGKHWFNRELQHDDYSVTVIKPILEVEVATDNA